MLRPHIPKWTDRLGVSLEETIAYLESEMDVGGPEGHEYVTYAIASQERASALWSMQVTLYQHMERNTHLCWRDEEKIELREVPWEEIRDVISPIASEGTYWLCRTRVAMW